MTYRMQAVHFVQICLSKCLYELKVKVKVKVTKIYSVFLYLRCIHANLLKISHCIYRSGKDKVLINICSHMATICQGHKNLLFFLILNEKQKSESIGWLKGQGVAELLWVNILYFCKLGQGHWYTLVLGAESPLSRISIK